MKNDQRDARVLSEVSCRIELPSVHVPSALARETGATVLLITHALDEAAMPS